MFKAAGHTRQQPKRRKLVRQQQFRQLQREVTKQRGITSYYVVCIYLYNYSTKKESCK